MRIIQAGPRDIALLIPLFVAYRRFYRLDSDPTVVRHYLARRIALKEARVFMAVDGTGRARRALGFMLLYPTFSSLQMGPVWVLNDLYVVAEARQRGVGRALMERARDLAVRSRARYLMLETARTNRAARRLYESLGWVRERGFDTYVLSLSL